MKTPRSVIDKWLHYDLKYSKPSVYKMLDIPERQYNKALERPDKYFTVAHMKIIAILTKKDVATVFWGCWKVPIGRVLHDKGEIRIQQALDRILK